MSVEGIVIISLVICIFLCWFIWLMNYLTLKHKIDDINKKLKHYRMKNEGGTSL